MTFECEVSLSLFIYIEAWSYEPKNNCLGALPRCLPGGKILPQRTCV